MSAAVLYDLPYLSAEKNRHGNPRLYVRFNGRRVQLKATPSTPAFMREYAEAIDRLKTTQPAQPKQPITPQRGTLRWLGSLYFASAEYLALNRIARKTRRSTLDACFNERRDPELKTDLFGSCPLSALSTKHIRLLRDRRATSPGAANNRLKYLSAMFAWAIEQEFMTSNPVRDVKKIKYATDGFHTWTAQEVMQFEAYWKIGTKPRLAMALLRFTGARRGDMVTFGKQHIKNGAIRYIPSKTKYIRMTTSEKPILPELQRIIDASPTGDLTLLVTEFGKPFSAAGFGNWFRDKCNEAGLPNCSAHGLKKAAATMAAEQGATDRQLMAMFDWSTASQANVYTKKAEQRRLAGDAMGLLLADRTENASVAPKIGLTVAPSKKRGKPGV
jgi:integrase